MSPHIDTFWLSFACVGFDYTVLSVVFGVAEL